MPKLMQPVNPPNLPKPAGYAHGWEVQGGKTVYIAGQVALNQEGHVVGKGDLAAQFRQVCENLKAVVTARGGQMNDMASAAAASEALPSARSLRPDPRRSTARRRRPRIA